MRAGRFRSEIASSSLASTRLGCSSSSLLSSLLGGQRWDQSPQLHRPLPPAFICLIPEVALASNFPKFPKKRGVLSPGGLVGCVGDDAATLLGMAEGDTHGGLLPFPKAWNRAPGKTRAAVTPLPPDPEVPGLAGALLILGDPLTR